MNFKFKIGDIVYLKTDTEQKPRIVTGILIRNDYVKYYITQCDVETSHSDFEMSIEINEIVKMFN